MCDTYLLMLESLLRIRRAELLRCACADDGLPGTSIMFKFASLGTTKHSYLITLFRGFGRFCELCFGKQTNSVIVSFGGSYR